MKPDATEIDKRLQEVEGWLETHEALALAELAEGQIVLEVGSYKGRSALAMAPYAEKVICIDHFHAKDEGQGYDPDKHGTRGDFEHNLREWLHKVEIHELDSKVAVTQTWPDVGLLFIDGGHEYETICSDLGFTRFVKLGGYAAFHDFLWPGVERALREKMGPDQGFEFYKRVGGIVVYKRVQRADPPDDFGRIVLALPYERMVYAEFLDDYVALEAMGLRPGDMGLRIWGLPAHRSRNNLIRMFLQVRKSEAEKGNKVPDTLCFVDSDMRFKENTLERLRTNPGNAGYDVVQAWYCTKYWPYNSVSLKKTQEDHPFGCEGWWYNFLEEGADWHWGDLVECDGAGGGFTLIRAKVLEALISPLGPERTTWFAYVNDASEDLFFCKHAKEKGFRIAVDTAVQLGHIRHAATNQDDYMRFREGVRQGLWDKDGKKLETRG